MDQKNWKFLQKNMEYDGNHNFTMDSMKLGIIGLGRMGTAIAIRALQGNHEVFGFDLNKESRTIAEKKGITIVDSIEKIAQKTRIIWIMVPAGDPVDSVIKTLQPHIQPDDIVIDGGNSKYTDSITRADTLLKKNVYFLDCGTSGGIHGEKHGFCLMVGGNKKAYEKIYPLLTAIAVPKGVEHIGVSGTGHYIKMIHNGIEYALLQAYAEGFQLLKEGSFKKEQLDLEKISHLWQHGSIIRSFILQLTHSILEQDQTLETISGEIAESGMGKWTVQEAKKNNIPLKKIEESLNIRAWSRETGGNYATKIVALLRNKFGGHMVKKINKK